MEQLIHHKNLKQVNKLISEKHEQKHINIRKIQTHKKQHHNEQQHKYIN